MEIAKFYEVQGKLFSRVENSLERRKGREKGGGGIKIP